MSELRENALRAGRSLLLFAAVAVALLALVHRGSAPRIAAAEAAYQLQTLQQILPAGSYDNDLLSDTLRLDLPPEWSAPGQGTLWRARRQDQPVAVILPVRAPDGYSGAIDMLVGIRHDGTLAGVRVTQHRETPGLGDAIEIKRSNWVRQFDARSLFNPGGTGWAVKKDGGVFDQLTGATITPRAIVKAVHAALAFHARERDTLYQPVVAEGPGSKPQDTTR